MADTVNVAPSVQITAPADGATFSELDAIDAPRAFDEADPVIPDPVPRLHAALVASTDWVHARETNRSSDVVIRGADKTPLYLTVVSVTITFEA